MIMPAEFGESHTSSFISIEIGTSPKFRPSRRIIAHLRSSSHGTWSVGPMWMFVLVERGTSSCDCTDCVFEIFFEIEPLALEHVHEVHVAAEVQLVRPVELGAAVLEQLREHAVGDRGADLALDVVADDRDARVAELPRPFRVAGDEDRKRVHERDAGVDRALGVEARGLLGADRQVGHQDVGLARAELATMSASGSSDSVTTSR